MLLLQVILEDDDEFVIISNRRLWEVLSIQEAVREARAEANPVLAAKRLQDLGQAYGAEDNLSVLVVRLSIFNNNVSSNSNNNSNSQQNGEQINRLIMRELRQAGQVKEGSCTCPCCMPKLTTNEAPAACCCHAAAAAAANANNVANNNSNGNNSNGNSESASSSVNGFYLNGVLRNVMSNRLVQLADLYFFLPI